MADKDDTLAPRDLSLTVGELETIYGHFRNTPRDFLLSPTVSAYVAVNRLQRVDQKNIRTLDDLDDAVIEQTVEYNLKELLNNAALIRPSLLVNAFKSIHYVHDHIHEMQVLSVGPRSEAELLLLIAAGCVPENVRGLDLISYSEFVDLGDMHAMPYDDDSFDAVILGWVLGYSHDCRKVAEEVVRVARPGAYVAIGCERPPPEKRGQPDETGVVLDGTFFDTVQEYLDLFEGHVHDVPVRHEVHRKMQDEVCHLIAVLELI